MAPSPTGAFEDIESIAEAQIAVAEEWIGLAESAAQPALIFVALWSALNAIYWLWWIDGGKDGVRKDKEQLLNLVRQISASMPQILNDKEMLSAAAYFTKRGPIRKMGSRGPSCPEGNDDDGRDAHGTLSNTNALPLERLQGIANIVYLVRNNLVHSLFASCSVLRSV